MDFTFIVDNRSLFKVSIIRRKTKILPKKVLVGYFANDSPACFVSSEVFQGHTKNLQVLEIRQIRL